MGSQTGQCLPVKPLGFAAPAGPWSLSFLSSPLAKIEEPLRRVSGPMEKELHLATTPTRDSMSQPDRSETAEYLEQVIYERVGLGASPEGKLPVNALLYFKSRWCYEEAFREAILALDPEYALVIEEPKKQKSLHSVRNWEACQLWSSWYKTGAPIRTALVSLYSRYRKEHN